MERLTLWPVPTAESASVQFSVPDVRYPPYKINPGTVKSAPTFLRKILAHAEDQNRAMLPAPMATNGRPMLVIIAGVDDAVRGQSADIVGFQKPR